MGVERATPARERGLFEFLAASRPQRGWWESTAASAASMAGHAAIIGAVVAATLVTTRVASSGPPTIAEKLDIVDLVPPSVAFPHVGPLAAAASAPASSSAERRDGRKRTPAPADAERGRRLLAALVPPTIVPDEIPLPNPELTAGAIYASEYDGIGQDSTLTAAAIFADHHERTADDLETGPPNPSITPYTQAPELANGDEMKKVLSRRYPPYLKDQGVGGRVLIWFLVDEYGHARRWLLKQSSGHRSLDKAAMLVAAQARFRPAMNYDRRVPVWVVLPVTFQVIDES